MEVTMVTVQEDITDLETVEHNNQVALTVPQVALVMDLVTD